MQAYHLLALTYAKNETDTSLSAYTTSIQLYNDLHIKSYINQMFLTSTQMVDLYYTRTETNELWATKLSTPGGTTLGDLKTWPLRSSGIKLLSYDDDNWLRILQL